jgi:hypothetical protein
VKLIGAVLAALLVFAPAAPAAAAADCDVDNATLTWGFKESFRSYISGTIANGEWTVADGATYETPNFGFDRGTGSYDGNGSLAFDGSIRFTGHGGILDTTVANPEVRFDGGTATLYLDVRGTTQQGDAVDEPGVEFASIDLAGHLESTAGDVSIVDAPATLTDDGAAAFGTYESGEALDPITVSFTTGEDCAAAPAPIWLFGVLVILVVAAGTVVLLLRWRRQGA